MAVSVYVLVAIDKKRLNLHASLYTLLEILSVTLFEKMPVQKAFPGGDSSIDQPHVCNQLNLLCVNRTLLKVNCKKMPCFSFT